MLGGGWSDAEGRATAMRWAGGPAPSRCRRGAIRCVPRSGWPFDCNLSAARLHRNPAAAGGYGRRENGWRTLPAWQQRSRDRAAIPNAWGRRRSQRV